MYIVFSNKMLILRYANVWTIDVNMKEIYTTQYRYMYTYSTDQSKVKRFRIELSTAKLSSFVIYSLTN